TATEAAIDVNFDSEWLSIIDIGTPQQDMAVVLDTGSADLWVFSTECASCSADTHDLFDPETSRTFINSSTPFTINYADGSQANGHLGYDVLNLGGINVQNQTVQIATSISANLNRATLDGILGLGFNRLASVSGTKTPIDNMISQNLIAQPMFGVQLIKANKAPYYNGGGGAWTFGGYDSSVISGDLVSTAVTRKAYWQIAAPRISVGLNGAAITVTHQFIVDSGTTLVLMANEEVSQIYAQLPGGTYNSAGGYWSMWCNA
ncbi:acid protease, partial [Saitoella complicata NRRL Y-17804]